MGTGMGYSMIDFSIRENAAIFDGPIVIIRIGTYGFIDESLDVGNIIVYDQSVMITRNPDAFRKENFKRNLKIAQKQSLNELSFYRISLPCFADEELSDIVNLE